jgi:transcriptional regulator with XRE-family HTH domain
MPTADRATHRGQRRARFLVTRVGGEFLIGRLAAGLSQRQLGAIVGVSHTMIGRIERGEARSLSISLAARIAAVLGLELSVGLHPAGPPVRDKAHLALIERMRVRVSPTLRWRTEVVVPVAGDPRSADAVITGPSIGVLVEAETRLSDVQAVERRIGGKQRDLGLDRVVLLLADTATNRRTVARIPELARRFPIPARSCLRAFGRWPRSWRRLDRLALSRARSAGRGVPPGEVGRARVKSRYVV